MSSVFGLATGAHSLFGALQVEPLAPVCAFELPAAKLSNYCSELEDKLAMTDCNYPITDCKLPNLALLCQLGKVWEAVALCLLHCTAF